MFNERFTSVTGVALHFEAEGVEAKRGKCDGCGQRGQVFPWPLVGFGSKCASCIVVETSGTKRA